MRLKGRIVVWPANLDSSKTRREGRKLAKEFAVQAPRLDEIGEASKRLSIEVEPIAAKARPTNWWEKGGYLTVARKGRRTEVLRSLAEGIRGIRSSKRATDKGPR